MLEVVAKNGYRLAFLDDASKNDPEIVQIAVDNEPYAFQFASKELKNNKDFALYVLKKNGLLITEINETLLQDFDVINTAVRSKGLALNYAPYTFKNNRELYYWTREETDMIKYDQSQNKWYFSHLNDYKCLINKTNMNKDFKSLLVFF